MEPKTYEVYLKAYTLAKIGSGSAFTWDTAMDATEGAAIVLAVFDASTNKAPRSANLMASELKVMLRGAGQPAEDGKASEG